MDFKYERASRVMDNALYLEDCGWERYIPLGIVYISATSNPSKHMRYTHHRAASQQLQYRSTKEYVKIRRTQSMLKAPKSRYMRPPRRRIPLGLMSCCSSNMKAGG